MSSGNRSNRLKAPYKNNTAQRNSFKAYPIKVESIAMIDHEGLSWDSDNIIKRMLYVG